MIDMNSKKHFINIADLYEELRPVYTPVVDKLAEVLELKENDVVVDYGCGPAHDLKYLSDKYKIKPIGIDKSPEMCRVASERNEIENVINGDNQSFVSKLNFDKIYFKFVMHHISNPLQFMDDIITCMKIGNSFAIVTMLPENVESYIVLRYFPALRTILESEAKRQLEIIEHIQKNPSIIFNIIEYDVNEEIFDETLIDKIQKNYSSFVSLLSEQEKKNGIEKIRSDINNNYKNIHLTKGIICYGRKY